MNSYINTFQQKDNNSQIKNPSLKAQNNYDLNKKFNVNNMDNNYY